MQLATDYKPNETIEGILRLSLTKGELIPENTSVIINIGGEEHKYSLIELISEEGVEGNYYVKDSSLSGSGNGYGIQGAKYSYPKVNFELKVADETPKETNETSSSEQIKETQVNETSTQENIETTSNETSTETTITGTTTEISSEETSTQTETTTEENTETTTPETSSSEISSPETTSPAEAGITGQFIHFFTGLVSLKVVEEESIVGSVTYDNPAEYNLPEGKTAVLVDGSVSVNGEKIDDSYVDVSVANAVATITTNYRQAEYGFGEDYINNEEVYYDLNLSKLDLTAKEGKMNIKLIYGDSIITETSSDLAISKEELEVGQNTTEQNNTLAVEPFTLEDPSIYDLTEEEMEFLVKKAGTSLVNITKSEILNSRLVLKYKLGKYWTEFSYDYDGQMTEDLLKKIEIERKYWLKSLAKELSKELTSPENINFSSKRFNLNESNNLNINLEENISEKIIKKQNETEETKKNETAEIQNQEKIKNKTEENATKIAEENVSIAEAETPVEDSSEIPTENTTSNSENVSSEETTSIITGQTVSQPSSQANLFERLKSFAEDIISGIKASFG